LNLFLVRLNYMKNPKEFGESNGGRREGGLLKLETLGPT
jgi:hypothetical protein